MVLNLKRLIREINTTKVQRILPFQYMILFVQNDLVDQFCRIVKDTVFSVIY